MLLPDPVYVPPIVRLVYARKKGRLYDVPSGVVYVDMEDRSLTSCNFTGQLPPRTFQVLLCFLMNANKSVDKWLLFYTAWNIDERADGGPTFSRQVVDNQVSKLRALLPTFGLRLQSTHGFGWYIQAASPSPELPTPTEEGKN